MRITLVGSRHFGVTALNALRDRGVEIGRVVVHDGEDRLAAAARAAGIEVVVQADPKLVTAAEIAPGTELIVTAHSHARVSREALAGARLGGIGYHPSLLPRHRGIAAVEWTIKEGDPIAGGSIYHLADRMDAGAIAAQDWVFVKKGETARELWERRWPRSACGCSARSSSTPRPTRPCPPSRRMSNLRPRRRICLTASTSHRLKATKYLRMCLSRGSPAFAVGNQIHHDVLEFTGTFTGSAAQQILNTL